MRRVFLSTSGDYIPPFRDERAKLTLQLETRYGILSTTEIRDADMAVFILDYKVENIEELISESKKTNKPVFFWLHEASIISEKLVQYFKTAGIEMYRYWLLSDISLMISRYFEGTETQTT